MRCRHHFQTRKFWSQPRSDSWYPTCFHPNIVQVDDSFFPLPLFQYSTRWWIQNGIMEGAEFDLKGILSFDVSQIFKNVSVVNTFQTDEKKNFLQQKLLILDSMMEKLHFSAVSLRRDLVPSTSLDPIVMVLTSICWDFELFALQSNPLQGNHLYRLTKNPELTITSRSGSAMMHRYWRSSSCSIWSSKKKYLTVTATQKTSRTKKQLFSKIGSH